MRIGLRRAWSGNVVQEEPEPYGPERTAPARVICFHHEQLDTYFARESAARLMMSRILFGKQGYVGSARFRPASAPTKPLSPRWRERAFGERAFPTLA